jgi:two-component system response regulator HydG
VNAILRIEQHGVRKDAASRPAKSEYHGIPAIVGESPRMGEIYTVIRKAASWDANVCIQGENGTGKELVARALHFSGPRRDNPFVTLDCSTIAEGLIESHLFGHVRGAFTGAVSSRQGVFAQAHTGTVFIDEITELAPHLQAKLLRVIQTGEFTMVGGTHPQRVNVRIITATNRDLRLAVAKGTFREDLYFRIAVVHIMLPPLRERREDVPLLAAHFLQRFVKRTGTSRSLVPEAVARLLEHDWPGNVRELENVIEQAAALAAGAEIRAGDVQIERHGAAAPYDGSRTLAAAVEDAERRAIEAALARGGGDLARVARELGVSGTTLWRKMKRLALHT